MKCPPADSSLLQFNVFYISNTSLLLKAGVTVDMLIHKNTFLLFALCSCSVNPGPVVSGVSDVFDQKMATPSKTPPGADPKQLERTGTVREIGSQAVWSLSSCKPGQCGWVCLPLCVSTSVCLTCFSSLVFRLWCGSAEGWQPGDLLAVWWITAPLSEHTV